MPLRRCSDRNRDEELRRVYRAHVRAVYAFLAYSVSPETAEDLTSLTFERVIRAWESFDPQRGSERTWILSIARNVLMDHFRRDRLRSAVSTDEHPALLDALGAADDPLAERLRVEGLKDWLGQLGEREREILALRYGADLQAGEIADLIGLSVANVHQIASRGLRRLRKAAELECMAYG